LAEFYANDLGDLLGVSTEGFDVYVREDKSLLGDEQLNLTEPRSVRKGEMTPLYHLLFWFVIKN